MSAAPPLSPSLSPPVPGASEGPLSPERVSALCQRIWAGGPDPVFAVLDGARSPLIVPALRGIPRWCLFSGNLSPELAAAAPYLAALDRWSEATQALLASGWGKSWGVLLAAPTDAETLRRHLRRFLRVQDPRGKTVYFRYYDPRVLRAYLPTCNAAEVRGFFGPIARIVIEGKDPQVFVEHRNAGEGLSMQHVRWDGDA